MYLQDYAVDLDDYTELEFDYLFTLKQMAPRAYEFDTPGVSMDITIELNQN